MDIPSCRDTIKYDSFKAHKCNHCKKDFKCQVLSEICPNKLICYKCICSRFYVGRDTFYICLVCMEDTNIIKKR